MQHMPEVMELHDAPAVKGPPLKFRFTPENAREMALRGAQARRERRAEIEAALAQTNVPMDQYVEDQIRRTRAQIARLQDKLDKARDAKNIKALSESLWRLTEVERVLSGRPLPSAKTQRAPDAPRTTAANPIG